MSRPPARVSAPAEPVPAAAPQGSAAGPNGEGRGGCTQAQLRRFIKSRPYIPMHELRRRFELNGGPDDVAPVRTPDGTIWVGLPPREAGFLGELVRTGEVGVELCHDPDVAVVMGVFAMKPVAR